MPLGIYPTVDYVFKRLFGDPANSDLLIHLLNAVLQPASPITEVEIINPFLEKEFEDDKCPVLDILAEDQSGGKFNVEMQTTSPFELPRRLVYYASALYGSQLLSGESYTELVPVISICFLSRSLFPGLSGPHLRFSMSDLEHQIALTDQLQVHTIELDKYNYQEERLATADSLERWSFFLQRAAEFEASELRTLLPEVPYRKATGIVEMISHSPEQRRLHEARLRAQRDQATHEEYLKRSRQDGLRQGLQEGLREGLIGQIRLLERLSKETPIEASILAAAEIASLQSIAASLEAKFTSSKTT